jgi:hypothetical protein
MKSGHRIRIIVALSLFWALRAWAVPELSQGSYQEAYNYANGALRNNHCEANRFLTVSLLTYNASGQG